MKRASVRELRYHFSKLERRLREGEEIQITKRRRIIARLIPETNSVTAQQPDFLGRLRAIYGDKLLDPSGGELIAEDRSRY